MRLTTEVFVLLPSFITAFLCAATPQLVKNPAIPIRLCISASGNDIFNNTIRTRGHHVTTPTGGTHKCDGTNNHAHRKPGATPTSALADAAHRAHFTFDGQWFDSFEDFFITEIGGISGSCDWEIKRNGVPIDVGGCQEELDPQDWVSFTCN